MGFGSGMQMHSQMNHGMGNMGNMGQQKQKRSRDPFANFGQMG